MDKLLLFTASIAVFMVMLALQTDEEMAMHALFQAKHAVNAATHAASQQADTGKLARGVLSIDTGNAEREALTYLRGNLRLDTENIPLPGSFFQTKVEVLALEIVNENKVFPYLYENPAYSYSVELQRPGVVMIIRVEYPRTFAVLGPIVLDIKSASELVY